MTSLIARFTVTGWTEREVSGLDGWVSTIEMRKTFTAGLTGESVALFVSSGEVEGSRAYFAAERITARTEDGRSGSLTVHHGGLESAPDTWFGHVVPHTGTGDFTDWAGSARVEHDDQGAFMIFSPANPAKPS